MIVFDIGITLLFIYGLYNGLKNGFFVEFASLIAVFIGVYVALKFSCVLKVFLQNYENWLPKNLKYATFGLTFLLTVIGIHFFAKTITKLINIGNLKWLNKIGGVSFNLLKNILILVIILKIFEKINVNYIIIKQNSLNNSVFYNPIKKISKFVFPILKQSYDELKSTTTK